MPSTNRLSITEIGALIGPDAPRDAATDAAAIIAQHWTAARIKNTPEAAWRWIKTGEGPMPWVLDAAARATVATLIEVYLDLGDNKRDVLLEVATALAAVNR
jgi:hypothetical protein